MPEVSLGADAGGKRPDGCQSKTATLGESGAQAVPSDHAGGRLAGY